jgi:hypothetical protein
VVIGGITVEVTSSGTLLAQIHSNFCHQVEGYVRWSRVSQSALRMSTVARISAQLNIEEFELPRPLSRSECNQTHDLVPCLVYCTSLEQYH